MTKFHSCTEYSRFADDTERDKKISGTSWCNKHADKLHCNSTASFLIWSLYLFYLLGLYIDEELHKQKLNHLFQTRLDEHN